MDENNSDNITEILIRIFYLITTIEDSPIDIGHGTFLSASEFHIIDLAAKYPSDTLSSLAKKTGVTKGAISQMVNKLETKGYILKKQFSDDKKKRTLELTEKGVEAYFWHKSLHERMNEKFRYNLSDISIEEISCACNILEIYEKMLINSLDIRDEHLNWFKKEIRKNREKVK